MKTHWFLLSTALCACSGAAEIPDTPDLSALREQYKSPTATLLDSAAADEALSKLPPLEELAAAMRASGYATNGVNEGSGSTKKDSDSRLRIQGSLHVTLRCPGDAAAPSFDAATNGTIELTIGVRDNLIRSGVGGTAAHCVLRTDLRGTPVRVEVDGPLAFDLGGDIGLRQRWSGRLLMRLNGSVTIGDYEFSHLSARFTDDLFEYLFVLPGDEEERWFIAQLGADGLTLRDSRGTWTCPSGQPCGLR